MLVLLLLCLGLRANAQAVILENDVVRQEWLFANGWQSVQLCGLIPQQEYGFRLTGEMPLLAPVSWQVENGEFLSNTNGVLRFKADGSCATIQLYFHQADPVDQFPRGFSAWCTDCPQSKQVANMPLCRLVGGYQRLWCGIGLDCHKLVLYQIRTCAGCRFANGG